MTVGRPFSFCNPRTEGDLEPVHKGGAERPYLWCVPCNHRCSMSVNWEMILPHLVPLRQCKDSVLHLGPRWMMESQEQALTPTSLVVKVSPVFHVCYMNSAAWDKDQHSSRSLSTSAVGEKTDKYQPFWRRAISKLFALGKRHLLLFYAKDPKGMCFNFEKIRSQGTKHILVEILLFFREIFLKDLRSSKIYVWRNFKKCITAMFDIRFLISLRIYMKHGVDVCRPF